MGNMQSAVTSFCLLLACMAPAPWVSAADQMPPETHTGFWWHGMHWPAFWWIFPMLFLVMMVVFFLMMRKWGMGCMWPNARMCGPGFGENYEKPESAMEILNKRYAKGEIDRQEYEEKRAAISAAHADPGD